MSLKKNLKEVVESNPKKELYFFDESRFGTHSKLGYGWFPKGSRTPVKMKLGYQNFYVYSAVNPKEGKNISIIAPLVNTEWMNVYLEEMSKVLGDTEALLVMDQAGWHKAKGLKIPANITIIYLPPYSPELNPTERLWKYMKDHTIKNKIFSTLKQLEEAICDFINKLDDSITKSVCSFNY
jgi:transposase